MLVRATSRCTRLPSTWCVGLASVRSAIYNIQCLQGSEEPSSITRHPCNQNAGEPSDRLASVSGLGGCAGWAVIRYAAQRLAVIQPDTRFVNLAVGSIQSRRTLHFAFCISIHRPLCHPIYGRGGLGSWSPTLPPRCHGHVQRALASRRRPHTQIPSADRAPAATRLPPPPLQMSWF